MLVAARLRFRHRDCYSARLPAGFEVWHLDREGDGYCLMTIRRPPGADLAPVFESMRPYVDKLPQIVDETPTTVVARCWCVQKHPPTVAMANEGIAILWPTVFENGSEHYRVVGPSEALENAIEKLRAMGGVDVEKVIPLDADEVVGLAWPAGLPLTERQSEALRLAIARGYYKRPRGVTIADMADELGRSRATVQEHLQNAESVVMDRLGDLLGEAQVATEWEPSWRAKLARG